MLKAPIVGLEQAVGRIAGTQKWFLWYIDQPFYHISVYQVSWKGTNSLYSSPKVSFRYQTFFLRHPVVQLLLL